MDELVRALKQFVAERDWDQFHSPKNLSMALIVETAEVVEHFQWLDADESLNLSADTRAQVADEIGDVLIYLTLLAQKLEIDLVDAAQKKLERNAARFPPTQFKGRHSNTR
jgi:NTP pyrophosphatase (non-canonical NTP hydrolase)